VNVKVVFTEAAYFFVKDVEIDCEVYTDKDEWGVSWDRNCMCFQLILYIQKSWKKISDPILHIQVRGRIKNNIHK
jgi:hypothetical protein